MENRIIDCKQAFFRDKSVTLIFNDRRQISKTIFRLLWLYVSRFTEVGAMLRINTDREVYKYDIN